MLDITMPGRDGWDTARAIREEHGDDPMILMVSANVHDFQRSHREDDPHDDFLTKPFEFDALLDRIATLLGLERSEEHTSELQSLMRISYAVFCLNKKIQQKQKEKHIT